MNEYIGIIERDNIRKGTAFLLSREIAVTAKHVVITAEEMLGEIKEIEVTLIYKGTKVLGKTINLIKAVENSIDVVFIELDEVIEERNIDSLSIPSNELENYNCRIVGYPKSSNNPVALDGIIIHNEDGIYDINIVSYNTLQDYGGMSGSPIEVSGRVIGMAITQKSKTCITAVSMSEIDKKLGLEEYSILKEEIYKRNTEININTISVNKKTKETIRSIGPRYNTDFSVQTKTFDRLLSFVDKNKKCNFKKIVISSLQRIEKSVGDSSLDSHRDKCSVTEDNERIIGQLYECVRNCIEQLLVPNADIYYKKLITELSDYSTQLKNILEEEITRFEKVNGEHTFNNKSWRGYMASYMCTFPTQYLDDLIEAQNELEGLLHVLSEGLEDDITGKAILITGKGGIGKTHLLCDLVTKIIDNDVPALLMLGEWFSAGNNPLETISNYYSAQVDYEKFLAELNYEGKRKNYYIAICIDAINETDDSSLWNRMLPVLIEEISKYENLMLIISCRTIYINEYLDEVLLKSFFELKHNGFENNREVAISEFCEFYGVTINYESVNIPEFINPLMLKMLCEIASEQEDKTVEASDLQTLMDKFWNIKNRKISRKYSDYFSVNDLIVQKTMKSIADFLSRNHSLHIGWADLRSIVGIILQKYSIAERTSGLIKDLVSENLIREYEYELNCYSFGYQRFYEYLYACELVEQNISETIQLIKNSRISQGTLEMLHILYFKKYKRELLSDITNDMFDSLFSSFVSSLYWRNAEDYGEDSLKIIGDVLSGKNSTYIELLINGMLEVSTKTTVPINALYLHKRLVRMHPLERDYYLSYFLLKKYSQQYIIRDLCERAIIIDVSSLDNDMIFLWKILLCWATSSNDIKLRDSASKSLCSLFCKNNRDSVKLFELFSSVEDDYIQERLHQAVYSAVVINEDKSLASELITYYQKKYSNISQLSTNVLIRYYIRDLFEYALIMGWCSDADVECFRPPYKSKRHDINIAIIDKYKDIANKLFWDCTESDFARYTIPYDIDDYGLGQKDIGLLVFEDIVNLGYVNSAASKHDIHIDYTYGSLRNRDPEVERIGKKYQKIYLYREMGNIYDNYCYKPRYGAENASLLKPEQGIQFRKVDLMRLPGLNSFIGGSLQYPFYRFIKWEDEKWLKTNDVWRYIKQLFVCSTNNEYFILKAYFTEREDKKVYREIWMHFNTYVFDKIAETTIVQWFKGKDFEGRWMPEGFSIYENCTGEYPWSPFVKNHIEEVKAEKKEEIENGILPFELFTTVNEHNSEKDSPFFEATTSPIMYPSEFWYANLKIHWDGHYDFCVDGSAVFKNALENSMYINKEFLLEFLNKNDYGLLVTVLGEKQILGGGYGADSPGWADFSYSFLLNKDGTLGLIDRMYNVHIPDSVH